MEDEQPQVPVAITAVSVNVQDLRFQTHRVYTSDIPNCITGTYVDDHPNTKNIGDTPPNMKCLYLDELIGPKEGYNVFSHRSLQGVKVPNTDQFVTRQPCENVKMDPVTVHIDILRNIISYGPCKWYTVSKATKSIAEECISKSSHILKQWNSKSILIKAIFEKKVDIVKMFFRLGFPLPTGIMYVLYYCTDSVTQILNEIFSHAVTHSTVRDTMSNEDKLTLLRIIPNAIVQVFDVKNLSMTISQMYQTFTINAFDVLTNIHRYDLLDKIYTLNDLSEGNQRVYTLIQYLVYGRGNLDNIKLMIRNMNDDDKSDLLGESYDYISNDNPLDDGANAVISDTTRERMDRFYQLVHDEEYLLRLYGSLLLFMVKFNYVPGVTEMLAKQGFEATILQTFITMIESGYVLYNHIQDLECLELLEDYCMKIEDYSPYNDVYELWYVFNPKYDKLYLHIISHGYTTGLSTGLAYRMVSKFESSKVLPIVKKLTPPEIVEDVDKTIVLRSSCQHCNCCSN